MTDVAIDVEESTVSRPDLPADFAERVTLALKTTDQQVLADAERDFRGVYESGHEYIVLRGRERVSPDLHCLVNGCDPVVLRAWYEAGHVLVWEIPLGEHRSYVFESLRATMKRGFAVRNAQRGRRSIVSTTPMEPEQCPNCGCIDPEDLTVGYTAAGIQVVNCSACRK